MVRAAIFLVALASLAVIQAPGSRGEPSPIVGTVGLQGTEAPQVVPAIDWKWSLTQGGLTIVLLVVVWSYRRDFFTKFEDVKADKEILIELVAKTAATLTASEATNARLARALENRGIVPPGSGQ